MASRPTRIFRPLVLARLVLGLVVASIAVSAMAADQRRALVIGNGRYQFANHLDDLVNDARDMEATLEALNFKVDRYDNLTLEDMQAALARFAKSIGPGDLALIYYAGIGIQAPAAREADGTDSYLMPVDANPALPERAGAAGLSLIDVLSRLNASQASAKVIILEASRANPWTGQWPATSRGARASQGLAAPTDQLMRGAFIAFATTPGESVDPEFKGRDALFTQEILKRLQIPGITISTLFDQVSSSVEALSLRGKQLPWSTHSGRVGQIVLKSEDDKPQPQANVEPPSPLSDQSFTNPDAELAAIGTTIVFDRDSSELTPGGVEVVRGIAGLFRRFPETCLQVHVADRFAMSDPEFSSAVGKPLDENGDIKIVDRLQQQMKEFDDNGYEHKLGPRRFETIYDRVALALSARKIKDFCLTINQSTDFEISSDDKIPGVKPNEESDRIVTIDVLHRETVQRR